MCHEDVYAAAASDLLFLLSECALAMAFGRATHMQNVVPHSHVWLQARIIMAAGTVHSSFSEVRLRYACNFQHLIISQL
jgi:hypothetical protein